MPSLSQSSDDTPCRNGSFEKQPEERPNQNREKRDDIVPVRRWMLARVLIRGPRFAGFTRKLVYHYGRHRLQGQLVYVPQSPVTDEQDEHQQRHEDRRPGSDGRHSAVGDGLLADTNHKLGKFYPIFCGPSQSTTTRENLTSSTTSLKISWIKTPLWGRSRL